MDVNVTLKGLHSRYRVLSIYRSTRKTILAENRYNRRRRIVYFLFYVYFMDKAVNNLLLICKKVMCLFYFCACIRVSYRFEQIVFLIGNIELNLGIAVVVVVVVVKGVV